MRRIGLRSRIGMLATLFAAASGCLPSETPSAVTDLRVLGVALDPPDIIAPVCDFSLSALAAFSAPVDFTALIADAPGASRPISYELWACERPSDRICSPDVARVRLAAGETSAGELVLSDLPLGTLRLDDDVGTFLLLKVLENDVYRGLGGIRLPLVLRVRAGDEEIFAQKLMVFGCKFFPELEANQIPRLTGLTLEDEPWLEGEPRALSGRGPFRVSADDFSERQESYVVPSFELQPVHLVESWKLAWHTDYGRIDPYETGGTDFGGGTGRHHVEWSPPENAQAREVTVWVVVRDGRGGASWETRRIRYTP